ncbi:MAG: hypothetical protein AAF402_16200 [Pseudomonadota bacterium]
MIPLFGEDSRSVRNVIVVAKSGGDFDNPAETAGSITDASESNPYLILIAPGEYQIGDEQIILNPFVELVGSGKTVTRLVASIGSSLEDSEAAVIVTGDETSVSNLSIENTRTSSNSLGIFSDGGSSKIDNVSITTASGSAGGFQVGILSDGAETKITRSEIELDSGGVQVGIFARNQSVLVVNHTKTFVSNADSFQWGVSSFSSELTAHFLTLDVSDGSSRQWGVQTSGGLNVDSRTVLDNLSVVVNGGTSGDQIGVDLSSQGPENDSIIQNSTVSVDGGTADYAASIQLTQSGNLKLLGSNVECTAASDTCVGMTQNIDTKATISSSSIAGADEGIRLGGGTMAAIAHISDSFLSGGKSSDGTYNCSFVFENFNIALDENCDSL